MTPVATRDELERALRRLGDWRLDKAREHVEKLRRFAQTKDDHDFIDRFSGWLMFVREVIDETLRRPARPGAGPTDEELKIALTEMGKRVMCLHLELEPSIANDVHQCFEALRRLVAARLAPGATGATGGGA